MAKGPETTQDNDQDLRPAPEGRAALWLRIKNWFKILTPKKKILLGLISVLVIAAIGIIIYFAFGQTTPPFRFYFDPASGDVHTGTANTIRVMLEENVSTPVAVASLRAEFTYVGVAAGSGYVSCQVNPSYAAYFDCSVDAIYGLIRITALDPTSMTVKIPVSDLIPNDAHVADIIVTPPVGTTGTLDLSFITGATALVDVNGVSYSSPSGVQVDNSSYNIVASLSGTADFSLDPASDTVSVGQVFPVQFFVNTNPSATQLVAVSTIINFDTNYLAVQSVDVTNPPWDSGFDPQIGAGEIRIIRGTPGDGVPDAGLGQSGSVSVVTINFVAQQITPPGSTITADVSFNNGVSEAILDDALGTNIFGSSTGASFTIIPAPEESNTITRGPFVEIRRDGTSYQAVITWRTSYPSDSAVGYGTTSEADYGSYTNFQTATPNPINPEHQVIINNINPDVLYYYRVRSIGTDPKTNMTMTTDSLEHTFSVSAEEETLYITYVEVVPTVNTAEVTWGTNLNVGNNTMRYQEILATGLGPWVTVTPVTGSNLVHSGSITGLRADTAYRVEVTSTLSTTNEDKEIREFRTLREGAFQKDSNVILKVKPDRECAKWLECTTSLDVTNTKGEREQLCFSRDMCQEINPEDKTCLSYINRSTAANLNFDIVASQPDQSTIKNAKNLSGYAKAGANWIGFSQTNSISCLSTPCTDPNYLACNPADHLCYDVLPPKVSGYLPYDVMREVGSGIYLDNGDFESGTIDPWHPRFAERNISETAEVILEGNNHVMSVGMVDRDGSATNMDWDGVMVNLGRLGKNVEYVVSFQTRISDLNMNTDKLRVQLGLSSDDEKKIDYNYYLNPDNVGGTNLSRDIPVSTGYQTVSVGPFKIDDVALGALDIGYQNIKSVWLAFLLNADRGNFYIDNVQIQPVLERQIPSSNITAYTEQYVGRSCRLYPKTDSPACDYTETSSGKTYSGWKGYCVEVDPKDKDNCLLWWPIDVISGSQAVFSSDVQAGYKDRYPLYYCLETTGNYPYYEHQVGGYWSRNDTNETRTWFYDLSDLNVYRNELLELKINGVRMDDDGNGSYECGLAVDEAADYNPSVPRDSSQLGAKGTIIFNNVNKAHWEDSLDGTHKTCNNGQTYYNSAAYLRCAHSPSGSENDCNIVTAKLEFEMNKLKGVRIKYDDGSPGNGSYSFDSITMTYKGERCNIIAQVVTDDGQNKAWTSRIASQNYEVPTIKYKYNQDYKPFGAMVNPAVLGDPSKWPAMYVEPAETSSYSGYVTEPYQARAGSAYAINAEHNVGLCSINRNVCLSIADCPPVTTTALGLPIIRPQTCSIITTIGKLGPATCISGSNAGQECTSSADCGIGIEDGQPGKCVGYSKPEDFESWDQYEFALRTQYDSLLSNATASVTNESNRAEEYRARLGQIFGKIYKVWVWHGFDNPQGGRYVKVCDIDHPFTPTPIPNLPSFTFLDNLCWDLTGNSAYLNPPNVFNIKINDKSTGEVFLRGENGSVVLTFNSEVNPDHQPLTQYLIDWGDGSPVVGEYNLKTAPRADSNNPHVVSHTYIFDTAPDINGQIHCTGTASSGRCSYKPKIQIRDNWGWCNQENTSSCGGNGCYDTECDNPSPTSGAWQTFGGNVILDTTTFTSGRE